MITRQQLLLTEKLQFLYFYECGYNKRYNSMLYAITDLRVKRYYNTTRWGRFWILFSMLHRQHTMIINVQLFYNM